MGAVYEGVHEQIGRHAAIKVLHPNIAGNAQIAQRFFNEARAVNVIDHPSLVEVFDFGHLPDGTAFIVMEFLKGESLTARIRNTPGGMGADALRVTRQIASALAAAHAKQIIHRDLKPDNVMLVPDPEAPGGERAKVLDFGIAKVAAEAQGNQPLATSTHMIMGTPAYMAPEQCRTAAGVTDKADVYALGVMLFQMLSGRLPFESNDTMRLLFAHVNDPPPALRTLLPAAPPELEATVAAMLVKEPEQRPSMAQVVAWMEQLGARTTDYGKSVSAPSTAAAIGAMSTLGRAAGEVAQPTGQQSPAKKVPLVPIIAGAVLLVGVAAVLLLRGGSHGDTPGTTIGSLPPMVQEPAGGLSYCGRFAKLKIPAPKGFSVMSCIDSNGTGALVFSGSAKPVAACMQLKPWINSIGWTLEAETNASGNVVFLLNHGKERLSVACVPQGADLTYVQFALMPFEGAPRANDTSPSMGGGGSEGGGGGGGGASSDPQKLLEDAQDAYVHANYDQAIALAQKALDSGGDGERAWRLIGASGCFKKDSALVHNAYKHTKSPAHSFLRYVCSRNGVAVH
jgi:hypothetical protein